jgi:hypothetical protein
MHSEMLFKIPEGKSLLGRAKRRWEGNIIMDIKEMWCGALEWIIWFLIISSDGFF